MGPQGIGFLVVHHEAASPQHTGNAKRKFLSIYLASIHDAVVAQMSPGSGDRLTAKMVVDDFASGTAQHVNGIGSRMTIDFDA